mmetsp:Transcript_30767/g.77188  ORF Transcript_30767/g.77188 Transcript_30767/m.77188 type:complete len:225 (-) Transcript_30767:702-1376(-)
MCQQVLVVGRQLGQVGLQEAQDGVVGAARNLHEGIVQRLGHQRGGQLSHKRRQQVANRHHVVQCGEVGGFAAVDLCLQIQQNGARCGQAEDALGVEAHAHNVLACVLHPLRYGERRVDCTLKVHHALQVHAKRAVRCAGGHSVVRGCRQVASREVLDKLGFVVPLFLGLLLFLHLFFFLLLFLFTSHLLLANLVFGLGFSQFLDGARGDQLLVAGVTRPTRFHE